ncbi:MAG: hypothetical protein IPL39_00350 [Opitutaceae bacterium]|nr:hypothetical protein [Opitutaceae bacterium]
MKVLLTKRFLAAASELSQEDRIAVDASLSGLLATFGRPHAHAGRSVRPLKPPVYELRASLALRVVFVLEGDVLKVDFVGDPSAMRDYLRNRR